MYCLKNVGVKGAELKIQRMLYRQVHRSYYDALGLTPKASHADIKQAYYKLSMQFHPDKTAGNDDKFREITAAYEILGNLKLRRLYDRGMLTKDSNFDQDSHNVTSEEHIQQKFYDSRSSRARVPVKGRTTVYNFDEWSRAHYAETFSRRENTKKYWRLKQEGEVSHMEQRNVEKGIFGIGLLLAIMTLIVTSGRSANPDKPSHPKKTDGS